MDKSSKPKKRILDGSHKLLSIKELIDAILQEASDLPQGVKQSLVQTRDITWQAFIKEQEKGMVKVGPVPN